MAIAEMLEKLLSSNKGLFENIQKVLAKQDAEKVYKSASAAGQKAYESRFKQAQRRGTTGASNVLEYISELRQLSGQQPQAGGSTVSDMEATAGAFRAHGLERMAAGQERHAIVAKALKGDVGAVATRFGGSLSGMMAGYNQMVGGIANPNKANAGHQVVSGAMGGIGNALQAVAPFTGPAAPFVEAGAMVAKFAGALTGATDKLHTWVNQLHEANMQFAAHSADMAKIQAEQEVVDIQRSKRRGDLRAESAGFLQKSKFQLDEEWARTEDTLGRAGNYVGGIASAIGGAFAWVINTTLLSYIELGCNLLDGINKNTEKQINFEDFNIGLFNMEKFVDEKYGKPKRFQE